MITVTRISMDSVTNSRLPLIEMETTIPDIEHPTSRADPYGDSQPFNLRSTLRRTRGFRRSFRRLFRHNANNGMTRSEFMNIAVGTSPGSSRAGEYLAPSILYTCLLITSAGLKLKSVISLNHIRRRSAADRIIQQSYQEEPAWWEDGMDEAVDQLPLLGASSRSGVI